MNPKAPSPPLEGPLLPGECIDHFMDGRIRLIQSKTGYRFSIDAILLSQFVTINPGDVVLDLGTGCGIIPLILLFTKPVHHVYGVEIQAELASQARRNALLNGFLDRMDIVLGDVKNPPLSSNKAHVIICNPPYRPAKSGRINPDRRRAIARHEIEASLEDILQAARVLIRKKGRLALIYPAVRVVDLLVHLRRFNFEPKRIQIHHPSEDSDAKLVLIEAHAGGRPGADIVPPLFGQGAFSIKK